MTNKNEGKGIWVYAEVSGAAISETAFELLARACELKSKLGGEQVTAVLLGDGVKSLAGALFEHGAERVICVESPALSVYKPRPYRDALVALAIKYRPSVFLLPASPLGRDVAPRVMCALGTGLTADATDLGVDEEGRFYHTTPAYGGRIYVNITIPEARPQMVTVRPGVFAKAEAKHGTSGELIEERLDIHDDADYVVVSTEPKPREGASLASARVVVAGGRGVNSEADVAQLRELADLLGGAVGGSRPVCDAGLLPHEAQIGQSMTNVKPEVLINFAISGAAQYVAGITKSRCVITVNKTKGAPIFAASHYVGYADFRDVLPKLIDEVKKRKNI